MHCLGWCHIVTPNLGKKWRKTRSFPSLPPWWCLFRLKSHTKLRMFITPSPHHLPLTEKSFEKVHLQTFAVEGCFFFNGLCSAKRSRFRVGHVLGGAYVQGLLCCMALFFGGGFSTSPQKVYEEIGFIHQDVLVIFEWDILHFYAKQPMSWVSPPAHDASRHQGWRLKFLGSGIPNLYLVL